MKACAGETCSLFAWLFLFCFFTTMTRGHGYTCLNLEVHSGSKKKSQSPNRSGICDLEGKEQQSRHEWLDYLVRVIKGCFKALPRPAFSLLWSRLETSGSPHKSSRGAGQLGGKVLHLKYCYSSLMLLPQGCFIYCSCWLNKKTHCSKVIFGTGAS